MHCVSERVQQKLHGDLFRICSTVEHIHGQLNHGARPVKGLFSLSFTQRSPVTDVELPGSGTGVSELAGLVTAELYCMQILRGSLFVVC